LFFFFFQAEDGIRDIGVTGFRRVLFRSLQRHRNHKILDILRPYMYIVELTFTNL